MSSSHTAGGGQFGDPSFSTTSRITDAAGQSPSVSQSRRNDESWVEISSQPSSSSLSSIGDDTAHPSAYALRRRRLQHLSHQQTTAAQVAAEATIRQTGTSSQEEYDETESEEDRLMTSSAENVPSGRPTALQQPNEDDEAIDDDDDEAATALGNPASAPAFRPQPNVFSHPPSHLTHRHSTSSSQPTRPPFGRPNLSARSYSRSHRDRLDPMSPAYQADNDAALRASLTTLLSCAAAARGLPKKEDLDIAGPSMGSGVRPSAAPMALRLVPESELMAETPPLRTQAIPIPAGPVPLGSGQQQPPLRTASNSSAPSAPSSTSSRDATPEKTKRGASSQQQAGRPPRATKKKRTSSAAAVVAATDADTAAATTLISPSLLTWVVSAGVLVLVSVVGFGAGYVIGREVGRQEGSGAAAALGGGARSVGNVSGSCGHELVKGGSGGGTLRKFRWGLGWGGVLLLEARWGMCCVEG